MRALIAFFARQHSLANLITFGVIALGLASALLIRRDVFPAVTFDMIRITTVYPGAGAEEVEKLVTNPIEQELKAVDGVRRILSDSTESLSSIMVELDPDQTTEEEGKREVQDAVDRWTDRPADSEEPLVTSLDSKQFPVLEVTLRSSRADLIQVREIAREIRRRIELIEPVARVVPIGYDDLEIHVEADPARLGRLRVSLQELIDALRGQNVTIPAGDLSRRSQDRIVRTLGEFSTPDEILDTVIRANEFGQPIRVRDVGAARYALEEATELRRAGGQPAVSLLVLKQETADAIDLAEQVKAQMIQERSRYADAGLEIGFVNDISRDISLRLSILNDNLYIGGLLVVLVLALALPLRLALVVSLAIPFSYLAAIFLFYSIGSSVNLVSLIGFILVTGLLVDNTVVVADNSYRRMQAGLPPEEAVIEGTTEVWRSVTAAALVTISVFVPMAFMSGIFGKFVREIPLAVISGMAAALFQGFFILPGQIALWVRPRSVAARERPGKGWRAAWARATAAAWARYEAALKLALRHRYAVLLLAVALFGGSVLFATGVMRVILFPPEGVEQFFVRIEAPTGTSLQGTLERLKPLEARIASLPASELEAYTSVVGVIQQDPDDPQTQRGSQFAQIAVFLTPSQKRERSADEIIAALRDGIGKPPGIRRVSFARVNPGPPVGKPISIGVQGESYDELLPAAQAVRDIAGRIPGVGDLTDTYILGEEEIRVRVIENEARAANLTALEIGTIIRAAVDGIAPTSIRSLDEEVDVRVKLAESGRDPMAVLLGMVIPNRNGDLIPLARVARFERGRSLSSYRHEDNRREIRVLGEIDTDRTSAARANALIRERIPDLQRRFPGVTFVFGGEDRDTRESFASLGRAFAVAVFAILLILVTLFRQILQPLLLLTAIPLGAISVIWTLWIHGLPISFMAMLGMIALGGVIVNNAIVLIDFININRSKGMDRVESILDAAGKRLRPVMLTTISAVVGVMPTAYGIGGLDMFVVPIALALGWGLVIGSTMTVFVIPCAVAALDDLRDRMARMTHRRRGRRSAKGEKKRAA